MDILDFSLKHSVINTYMSELRDNKYQKNPLLFRNNIRRIGQFIAYEISKYLNYHDINVETPLGNAKVAVPADEIVVATVLRAGLPMHDGILSVFDKAENAFASAYRTYEDEDHTQVGIHVEYLAAPSLDGKTLILADPMLATGGSMELAYKALLSHGIPKHIHIASVIAATEGINHIRQTFPQDKTTVWCGAIDPQLNEHKYIVPGLGDAGDLCFGEKL